VNPNIRVAFDLGEPVEYAWMFRRGSDRSLHAQATQFFNDIRASGLLDELIDRYYNQFVELDDLLAQQFLRDIRKNLSRYQALFEKAGARHGIDWRLLAAMGYQESKWQPDAVSHMGAQGLMQITRPTARHIGVTNPHDPASSINGAAAYLAQLRGMIPADTPEPDRTLLAVAAYNVGIGHLRDALVVTGEHGMNPRRWKDVRLHLPLLSDPKCYRKVRHGYARGGETVRYVENVRAFHDLMIWMDERRERATREAVEQARRSVGGARP
jgi:membrane-bound lytic murein transglycosylase F